MHLFPKNRRFQRGCFPPHWVSHFCLPKSATLKAACRTKGLVSYHPRCAFSREVGSSSDCNISCLKGNIKSIWLGRCEARKSPSPPHIFTGALCVTYGLAITFVQISYGLVVSSNVIAAFTVINSGTPASCPEQRISCTGCTGL